MCAHLARRVTAGRRLFLCILLLTLVAANGPIQPASAQDWSFAAPMPEPRYGMAAVELQGDIYVIGGKDRHGDVLAGVMRYDPETEVWYEDVPAMDRPRYEPAAVVLNGLIYVIGGMGSNEEALGSVIVYDPFESIWSDAPALELRRSGHGAVVHDRKIWVVGGRDDQGRLVEEVEIFDLSAGSWDILSDWTLESPRVSFALLAFTDVLYAMFGYGSHGPIPYGEQFQIPTEGQTFGLPHLLRGRLGTVTIDDTAYLLGGRAAPDRVISDVLLFTPGEDEASGKWRSGTPMLTARESFAVVRVGNEIYAVGGRTQDGNRDGIVLSSMEVLAVSTAIEQMPSTASRTVRLEQNHPNPFTKTTAIPFAVSAETRGPVRLDVFDARGRLVDTIFDGRLTPGRHEVSWDGGSDGDLPSGVYFYVLQQGENRQVRQMAYIP